MNNIYQRINEVRKAIGYVQKDKDVGFGKSSYRAVTHDAVTGMVRAALIQHGVVIVPSVVTSEFHQAELVTTIGDDGKERTAHAKQRLYEATFQIEFVNMDDPADRIVTQQTAHALDNGDKAPGKAMSYATKYAILKLFNIETGESDESVYQYQQEEYDFAGALTKAEATESVDIARSVIKEAKQKAIDSKDRAALDAVKTVEQRLTTKFGKKHTKTEIAGQA